MIVCHTKNTGEALAVKCMSFEIDVHYHIFSQSKLVLNMCSQQLVEIPEFTVIIEFMAFAAVVRRKTHCYLNSASCRIEIVTLVSLCISDTQKCYSSMHHIHSLLSIGNIEEEIRILDLLFKIGLLHIFPLKAQLFFFLFFLFSNSLKQHNYSRNIPGKKGK